MDFIFMDYLPTPLEKHLGIVKIKAWGKIVLRYKIVQKKDGHGFFPVAASYKLPGDQGEETYVSAFVLDSNSDKEEVETLIRSKLKVILSKPEQKVSQNFSSPSPWTDPNGHTLTESQTPQQLEMPF